MQLYNDFNSKDKFKVIFDEVETSNMKRSLGDSNISIRNLVLCYYIEKRLPKIFEECSNKRVMVLNIQNDDRYITALVLLQDINASFIKPKEKNSLFKATQITFQNAKSFKKWLLNRKRVYTYKITDNTSKSVKVVIFNMSKLDELSVSEVGAQINNVCSIAKYILLETAEKFEKCFS